MAKQNDETGELPLMSAGRMLREARQAQSRSIDAISAETKIAGRHLEAIEEDRFSDLASRTYAIGFSRAYARALGLEEDRIADCVRDQLDAERDSHPVSHTEKFEPGDPARVPPSALAWAAGLGFVAAIVALFLFWRSFLDPAGEMPDLVNDDARAPAAQAPAGPSAPARPAPENAAAGPVTITALENGVWVKVADSSGAQLYQKEMALGESYTVPAAAGGAVLATARPDALRLSVGERTLPQLGDRPRIMRDVPLDPASLFAREAAGQAAVAGGPGGSGETPAAR